MLALLVYVVVAAVALFLIDRFLERLTVAAALALVLLPCCFTGRALLTGSVIAPVDLIYQAEPLASQARESAILSVHNPALSDVYAQMIPWRVAVRDSLAHGEWPLWNRFSFAGDILAASAQPAPYHPLNLISYLLPLADSLTFLAAMLFFTAAAGAFLFARSLGCGDEAALTAAAVWSFSNFVVFFLVVPLGFVVVILPFILYSVRRLVRQPGVTSTTSLSIALTASVVGGHPETTLHVVLVGICYGIAELIAHRENVLASIKGVFIAGAVALLLSAIHLLPFMEAIPQTQEYAFRKSYHLENVGATSWNVAAERLVADVIPFVYGLRGEEVAAGVPGPYHLGANAYGGSIALALAVAALITSRRRVRWLIAAAVLVGALAGVSAPGVTDVFGLLPLLDIAVNERLVFVAALGISILAAFAVDELRNGRRVRTAVTVTLIFLAIVSRLIVHLSFMRERGLSDDFIFMQSVRLLVPLALVTVVLWTVRSRKWAVALILLALLAQRSAEIGGFNRGYARSAFYPRNAIIAAAQEKELARTTGWGPTLIPNTNIHYQLEDVRGFQATTLRRLYQTYLLWSVHQPIFFNRIDDLNRPFLEFLDVQRAFALESREVPRGWRVIATGGGTRLLERERRTSRVALPRLVHVIGANQDPVRPMLECNDFVNEGWIESATHRAGPFVNGQGTATIMRRGGSGYLVRTKLRSDAWVIVAETAWRGWRARIDGEKLLPLYFGNHAFIAFLAPAGDHSIELTYRPRSFVVGAVTSVATLLSVAAFFIFRRRRAR